MAHSTLTAPRVPTQAEIDAGLNRGRRLRSFAIRDMFVALFGSKETSGWKVTARTAS